MVPEQFVLRSRRHAVQHGGGQGHQRPIRASWGPFEADLAGERSGLQGSGSHHYARVVHRIAIG